MAWTLSTVTAAAGTGAVPVPVPAVFLGIPTIIPAVFSKVSGHFSGNSGSHRLTYAGVFRAAGPAEQQAEHSFSSFHIWPSLSRRLDFVPILYTKIFRIPITHFRGQNG